MRLNLSRSFWARVVITAEGSGSYTTLPALFSNINEHINRTLAAAGAETESRNSGSQSSGTCVISVGELAQFLSPFLIAETSYEHNIDISSVLKLIW